MFNLSRENPNQISPRDTVLLMIRSFQISQCIYAAVKLGILNLLGDGSKHYQELAKETNTHADSLYRLLRTLVSLGVLQENQPDYFQNTPLAAYLRDDQVGTLRNWLITEIEESYACWGNFTQSLTTGEGAFKATYGLDIEEYHRENPSLNKVYDQSMNDITTFQIAKILEAYDFSSVEVLADIGGGQGKLIAAILKRYPQIKGILFEQPYSLEKAKNLLKQEGVSERCELISGDFFESVPVVADVYLLKQVLLSWNDQQVVNILKNCRQYMPSTSRLLIAERIIRKIYWRDNLADLQLWMLHSGKIRSENELKVLLTSAGFQIDKIIDTMPVQSLIEASPLPKLN